MKLKKFLSQCPSIQTLETQLTSKKAQRDNARGQDRKDFEVEVVQIKSQLEKETEVQTKKYDELYKSPETSPQGTGVRNYAQSMVGATSASNFGLVGQAPSGKGF